MYGTSLWYLQNADDNSKEMGHRNGMSELGWGVSASRSGKSKRTTMVWSGRVMARVSRGGIRFSSYREVLELLHGVIRALWMVKKRGSPAQQLQWVWLPQLFDLPSQVR